MKNKIKYYCKKHKREMGKFEDVYTEQLEYICFECYFEYLKSFKKDEKQM